MTLSKDLQRFIRANVKSLAALELLLLLFRERGRLWSPSQLASELRGSVNTSWRILLEFERAGLVVRESEETYRFEPATLELDSMVRQLEDVYRFSPLVVVRTVFSTPNEVIQTLADAFKMKEEDK